MHFPVLLLVSFSSIFFKSVLALPEPVSLPKAAPFPIDSKFDDDYANPAAAGYLDVPADVIARFKAETSSDEVSSDADPWGGNLGHVQYKCETTLGSPRYQDVLWGCRALMEFKGADDWCPQKNPNFGCTLKGKWGTAAIGICGAQGAGLICGQIGWWAVWITKKCRWNGLAGGKMLFPMKAMKIYVFHVRDT